MVSTAMRIALPFALITILVGCQPAAPGADETSEEGTGEGTGETTEETPVEAPDVTASPISTDILAREPVTEYAMVQHVLISWDAKAPTFAARGGQDERGAVRTLEQANELAHTIVSRAQGGEAFETLMAEFSEDPGSADTGRPYEVAAGARLVQPFLDLGLRLNDGEFGVVESDFGYHIMTRIAPDPATSSEIMSRTAVTQSAQVRHILLSHQGNAETYMMRGGQDPRGGARTIEQTRELIAATLVRVEAGEDFVALMGELSEDPGSAASGTAYPVTPDAGLVPPFKHLSLRLNVDEVGVVPSDFGYHIIQRIE